MVVKLRALLEGRMTRAEVKAWTREVWPPGSGQGSPFTSPDANCVFDSILNLEERWGDHELVREVDLRAYLRWLGEGEAFLADDEALVVLERDLEDFAAQTGTEAIRWWLDGIGWCAAVRFCAPARGRPFVARGQFERPKWLGICTLRGDDLHDAIVDLFEALAIDDEDCWLIHPQVNLTRLPVWALWREDDNCNRFEVARFRSYAKAREQERMFTALGHKQVYWVDPA
ncbi:hypothetical protein OV079_50555 [Nannocystis pusilla]|uniref:Uncharacterized protein n=1 Tax=Nannocystis pusilla TaxID=889268 RepID=A0A9X3F1L9_9BACT|nr:hypothetical protein [Nannocystis pusilla]MCY1013640.1 hypothetical protein [Nannocystis pusilla]